MLHVRGIQRESERAVLQMGQRIRQFTGRIGFTRQFLLENLLEFIRIVEEFPNLGVHLDDIRRLDLVISLTGIPCAFLLATKCNLILVPVDVRPCDFLRLGSPGNPIISDMGRSGCSDTVILERNGMNGRSRSVHSVNKILADIGCAFQDTFSGLLVLGKRLKDGMRTNLHAGMEEEHINFLSLFLQSLLSVFERLHRNGFVLETIFGQSHRKKNHLGILVQDSQLNGLLINSSSGRNSLITSKDRLDVLHEYSHVVLRRFSRYDILIRRLMTVVPLVSHNHYTPVRLERA